MNTRCGKKRKKRKSIRFGFIALILIMASTLLIYKNYIPLQKSEITIDVIEKGIWNNTLYYANVSEGDKVIYSENAIFIIRNSDRRLFIFQNDTMYYTNLYNIEHISENLFADSNYFYYYNYSNFIAFAKIDAQNITAYHFHVFMIHSDRINVFDLLHNKIYTYDISLFPARAFYLDVIVDLQYTTVRKFVFNYSSKQMIQYNYVLDKNIDDYMIQLNREQIYLYKTNSTHVERIDLIAQSEIVFNKFSALEFLCFDRIILTQSFYITQMRVYNTTHIIRESIYRNQFINGLSQFRYGRGDTIEYYMVYGIPYSYQCARIVNLTQIFGAEDYQQDFLEYIFSHRPISLQSEIIEYSAENDLNIQSVSIQKQQSDDYTVETYTLTNNAKIIAELNASTLILHAFDLIYMLNSNITCEHITLNMYSIKFENISTVNNRYVVNIIVCDADKTQSKEYEIILLIDTGIPDSSNPFIDLFLILTDFLQRHTLTILVLILIALVIWLYIKKNR